MPLPIRRLLRHAAGFPPLLLVVVDTEEEFDWDAPFNPASRSVTNTAELPRAQAVFDRHGIIPIYMVDHPVATDAAAVAVLRGFVEAERCEVGAHLHPWVNPPAGEPIGPRNSYPGNLPARLERRKLEVLTEAITAAFGMRPTIYKAGRYGVGPNTAATLRELGYSVDISVVPHTDFSEDGGPDFSAFADQPFLIDEGLVEMPLSVGFAVPHTRHGPRLHRRLQGAVARRLRLDRIIPRLRLLERLRLSPEGHSLAEMQRQTRAALRAGQRVFMLTFHSSSLLPDAAPYVRSATERDAFLARLDGYLAFFGSELGGRGERVSAVAARLLDSVAQAGGEQAPVMTPVPGG